MQHTGKWLRMWQRLGLAQHQPDLVRLETDVDGMQAWLNAHEARALTPSDAKDPKEDRPHAQPGADSNLHPSPMEPASAIGPSWFEICNWCLDKAREAVECRNAASGYEYFHIAEREAVFGMSDQERAARSISLLAEFRRKYKESWRGEAVISLLDTPGRTGPPRGRSSPWRSPGPRSPGRSFRAR